jgi:hypothetical protein
MKNSGFQIPDTDLLSLVEEVRRDMNSIIKSEAAKGRLKKSDEGEESEPEGGESAPADDAPPAGGDAPPAGDPSASAPPTDGAPPAGDPSAPPADPAAGEAAPAAGPSFEELVTLYTQLPPEDFEAHLAAIQQAAQTRGGGAMGAPGAGPSADPAAAGAMGAPGAGPSAPPAGPSAPPSAGPGPSAPPSAPPSPGPEDAFKSETRSQVEALTKAVETLTKGFEAIVTAPKRKAVTGVTFVPMAKSEEPLKPARKPFADLAKNRQELHDALVEMTKDPSLKKSDRERINAFYAGSLKVEGLESLFAEKK